MKAVHKFLLGGAAAAAASVAIAAPAAAQYYPGGGGDVLVGAILNNILRGGYNGGYGGYNGGYDYANERWAVDQCARATEQRVNGGYYDGGYGGYGYNNAGLRVAQIDRVERTRNLNFRVYGLVTSAYYRGNYGGYGGYNAPYGGYGYNQQGVPAYRFSCKVSRSSGRITDIDLDRINGNYGYRRY
ncbi:hypothetical protein OMW55_10900 [Sphingomonas sp. BN140010]|uniref:17 kDa surface antigen n=1 Tax=Sphingomonas arvum TaxID=2992113 RepID=A0ABT3JHU5_9SPHN|nr:hypothetical protein [Sphingomonas sp. BN140010]MCW3798310.1 hypothetical protein [Sphingomonas sp. BN140010]